MADEHRSPEEIEREIARERSQLTNTLEEIQDRFSFEALSADVMNTVRGQSGDVARALSRSVKENPIPLALTAVGIAWLMFSSNRSRSRYDYDDDYDYDRTYGRSYDPNYATDADSDHDQSELGRTPRAGVVGDRYATDRTGSYGVSPRPASYESYGSESWDEEHYVDEDESGEGRWDRAKTFFSDKAHAASARASRAGHGAGAGLSSAGSSAQSGMHAAGSGLRSGAGRVSASGRRIYASARDLGSRISEGTHGLSEEARRRVVAARQRAYEAQSRVEYLGRRGSEKAADLYEDQPLVMGALALAVGAAIGGMLPHTRREDEALGSYRDQLFDEAERIYREEREKIGEVAKATADEAKQAARDAADRVAERAKTEASDKGVGHV